MFKKKIEPVTDRLAHWGGGKIKFPEDLFWRIFKKLARATQSYRKLPRATQSYRKLARATQSYGVMVAIAVGVCCCECVWEGSQHTSRVVGAPPNPFQSLHAKK